MARTPLFALIERSMRLASASLRTGAPADELAARLAEAAVEKRALSRRQFVAGTAAVAGMAALEACAPRTGATTTPPATTGGRQGSEPVLIVGAGIAGLTAAYRLRQMNIPVRVLEAQNRTGGRMFSLRGHFADGQVCELGGELIDTPHERIQALARELGIALDDLSTDDASLRETYWFGGAARTEREIVEAFTPVAARISASLATIADADVTYSNHPQSAVALDRMTIAEWLDGNGVTGWVRELLEVGYTTEYGLEIDRQSALNFLLMIDPDPDPFRIFGESDERFHVRGGNDLITKALADRVSDAIETGTVLESVTRQADGRYALAVRRDGGSRTLTASHVLLAIPFTLLREVRIDAPLSAAKRKAIAELGYGTNAKLMVGFSSRPWRQRGSNGSVLAELPFQLTWETSRLQPGTAGILTNFTGGRHGVELGQGTDVEQAQRLVADLDRVLPGVRAAHEGMKVARFHWPSHPWTKGSYASYLPGQWTSIRGAEGEDEGTLYFAGEHCSAEAQGFMEGGCESGELAAKAVLAQRGVAMQVG